jgi:hypothetical protein
VNDGAEECVAERTTGQDRSAEASLPQPMNRPSRCPDQPSSAMAGTTAGRRTRGYRHRGRQDAGFAKCCASAPARRRRQGHTGRACAGAQAQGRPLPGQASGADGVVTAADVRKAAEEGTAPARPRSPEPATARITEPLPKPSAAGRLRPRSRPETDGTQARATGNQSAAPAGPWPG